MPRPNLGKVRVSLTVRKDVLEASREYIPNLSQFLEDRLLEFLRWVNHPLGGDFNGSARIRTGDHCLVRGSFSNLEALAERYLEFRFSKVKSERSKIWIEKTLRKLLEHTKGKITRESLLRFQSWYMRNFGYESQKKFYDNTRAFLEYLYKETGDITFRELKEILDRPQRPSKKLNKIIIRPVDVENVIKAIYNTPKSPYDPPWKYVYFRIKHIANTLFLAYTGQRPQSTSDRLTFMDFEEALKRDPPMLWIPEEKDKESFPHWVPLHPVVVEWLKPVIEYRHLIKAKDDDPVFPYNSLRIVLIDLDIKAHHTGMRIQPSHFRKFFEQMCNNVLMVHPGLRDYIMAHNTGSLDVQSYDGKLPSEIYEQYMKAWGRVNLVPKGVSLKKLINQIQR